MRHIFSAVRKKSKNFEKTFKKALTGGVKERILMKLSRVRQRTQLKHWN